MQKTVIDINVDVGEGINNETQLFPYISSCNIACGGHAGDTETMRSVVKLAKQYHVKIGAHPSFPDKEGFGRKTMDISCAALYTSIKAQIDDLISVLREEHMRLNHIKPHGALYNLAAIDAKCASVIIEVMKSILLPVKLYVPYNSVIEKMAIENNIPINYEEVEQESKMLLYKAGIYDQKEISKEVQALSLSRLLLRKAQDHVLSSVKKLDPSKASEL